jgi:hypothetical protein
MCRNQKTSTHNIFATFPSFHLIQPSPGIRAPNGGCCSWSEPGMRKYDKSCAAIKNKKKKSAPTLNQEVLVKVFQSQRKNPAGTKQLLDQKERKTPINAWIRLTTLMKLMTMWQLTACPSNVPSFVIQDAVNDSSEAAYCDVK